MFAAMAFEVFTLECVIVANMEKKTLSHFAWEHSLTSLFVIEGATSINHSFNENDPLQTPQFYIHHLPTQQSDCLNKYRRR